MRFETWSYRFAEQVPNSRLEWKEEIEKIVGSMQVECMHTEQFFALA